MFVCLLLHLCIYPVAPTQALGSQHPYALRVDRSGLVGNWCGVVGMETGINHCRSYLVFTSLVSSHPVINWHTQCICYQCAAHSHHHMQTYTHSAHLSVILTHPHAGCLHSYCSSPHPVPAIATETSLTALLFLQIHPHFYSPWKNIFLYLFFPLTQSRNSPCLPSIYLRFPLGCLIRQPIERKFIFFRLPQKHKCKISRGL